MDLHVITAASGSAGPAATRSPRATADACGCALGARSMAAGFALAVAWIVARHGVGSDAFLPRLPAAVGVALACALAGKLVGMATARRRGRSELERLIRATGRLSRRQAPHR